MVFYQLAIISKFSIMIKKAVKKFLLFLKMSNSSQKYILLSLKGGIAGSKFPLKEGENYIGRWDPESGSFPEVNLDKEDVDAKVSRSHAKIIILENGNATIEDLGSLNGTYINRGPKLTAGVKCKLHIGDEIIIGKVFLKFLEG